MAECCPVSCYYCKPTKKDDGGDGDGDGGDGDGDGGDVPDEPEEPEPEPEFPAVDCTDNDHCLASLWGETYYTCANSAEQFCESEWAADMELCCPVSCYYCKPEPMDYHYMGCYKDDSSRDFDYGP